MRRFTHSMAALAVLLVAFAPAPAVTDDGGNVSCRLDGEATSGQAVGTATCLQADPETSGEFEIDLAVTLQAFEGGEWVDVVTDGCTAESVNGLAQAQCVAIDDAAPDRSYRALIDLESPKDWAPAVAQPVYQGGEPVQDPLAIDECDVNEIAGDSDLTAPDAPWADLCAVTLEHQLDAEGETLESVTVTIHVAGLVDLRAETTSWQATLSTADCDHAVVVDDTGITGTSGVRIETSCGRLGDIPCTGVAAILTELTGGACSAGSIWEEEATSVLAADAVEYRSDQLRVTLGPDDLVPLAAADLVAGQMITEVDALTSTGLGSGTDGSRVALDYDAAYSTGRTYALD